MAKKEYKNLRINHEGLKLCNMSEEDFVNWATKNNKSVLKIETKKEFFTKVISKKIYKDSDGNIVEEE